MGARVHVFPFPARSDVHLESGIHSKTPPSHVAIEWEAACRSASCILRVEKQRPRDFESSHDPLDTLLDGEVATGNAHTLFFSFVRLRRATMRDRGASSEQLYLHRSSVFVLLEF